MSQRIQFRDFNDELKVLQTHNLGSEDHPSFTFFTLEPYGWVNGATSPTDRQKLSTDADFIAKNIQTADV